MSRYGRPIEADGIHGSGRCIWPSGDGVGWRVRMRISGGRSPCIVLLARLHARILAGRLGSGASPDRTAPVAGSQEGPVARRSWRERHLAGLGRRQRSDLGQGHLRADRNRDRRDRSLRLGHRTNRSCHPVRRRAPAANTRSRALNRAPTSWNSTARSKPSSTTQGSTTTTRPRNRRPTPWRWATAPVSGINAALQPGGEVTGTVTNTKAEPLQKVEVCALDAEEFPERCTLTNAQGQYTIVGVAAGEHDVEFATALGDAEDYATQYYNGKESLSQADAVMVSDDTPATGINAALVAGRPDHRDGDQRRDPHRHCRSVGVRGLHLLGTQRSLYDDGTGRRLRPHFAQRATTGSGFSQRVANTPFSTTTNNRRLPPRPSCSSPLGAPRGDRRSPQAGGAQESPCSGDLGEPGRGPDVAAPPRLLDECADEL